MSTAAALNTATDLLTQETQQLAEFLQQHQRLLILTGAGCSTASGIPDYRDAQGLWKGADPIQHQDFVGQLASRKRYWARSMIGWSMVWEKQPNAAHYAIAQLQQQRPETFLVTQNVDGLHRQAGSPQVVELHGRLDQVVCLSCHQTITRRHMQTLLEAANAHWHPSQASIHEAAIRPDGDAALGDIDYDTFTVPACPHCQGVLMPDVVFFGGTVPKQRVRTTREHLAKADAVLVVGSSLMVWSGFRFIREAAQMGLPIAINNQGKTRADDLYDYKWQSNCTDLLPAALGL